MSNKNNNDNNKNGLCSLKLTFCRPYGRDAVPNESSQKDNQIHTNRQQLIKRKNIEDIEGIQQKKKKDRKNGKKVDTNGI